MLCVLVRLASILVACLGNAECCNGGDYENDECEGNGAFSEGEECSTDHDGEGDSDDGEEIIHGVFLWL